MIEIQSDVIWENIFYWKHNSTMKKIYGGFFDIGINGYKVVNKYIEVIALQKTNWSQNLLRCKKWQYPNKIKIKYIRKGKQWQIWTKVRRQYYKR